MMGIANPPRLMGVYAKRGPQRLLFGRSTE
jgi:hypothetical protein